MSGIVLGLVTVDGEPVAKYPKKSKLVDVIVQQVIPKLEKSNHKRTLAQQSYEFHYKSVLKDGKVVVFFCVASSDFEKRISWAYIDDIEAEFFKRNFPGSGFNKFLKERMEFRNDKNNDSISRVYNKIDEVKEVMIDNIDKVLERGTRLEELVGDTAELEETANEMRKKSRKVKQRMCLRHCQLILLLVFILLAIIVIAIFAGCGFPSFYRCIGVASTTPPPGGNSTSIFSSNVI